ncbi:MAG: c-type cytochrome [Legionella sp.]|uniref:c-type cytochrome n=1 Tax=Legionella sp. TaxID=459 RepID=UPI0039E67732
MRYFIILLFIVLSTVSLITKANSHHPQDFLYSISGAKNEGEQIYVHFCVNCHALKPLISLGAPRIRERADWQVRLKQGMSVLFKHTDEGLGTMPPRGGCFECTDKQLLLAIKYMLPKKQKH